MAWQGCIYTDTMRTDMSYKYRNVLCEWLPVALWPEGSKIMQVLEICICIP